MDQQPPDVSTVLHGEAHGLEESLKGLWERVRHAAEVILQLREEKRVLAAKVEQLDQELQRLRGELEEKDQLLKESELARAASPDVSEEHQLFTNGEREAMAAKVRDLLSRLENYL